MKNDKLLTELCRIEAGLQMGENVTAWVSLKNLIEEVKDEIRDECNKENGKSSVANAAKRILDTARSNTNHESLYKAYRGRDGLIICDLFRAVRFNLDDAPSLEEHPENYHDYPDIDRIIDVQKDNPVPLNVPSLAPTSRPRRQDSKRRRRKRRACGSSCTTRAGARYTSTRPTCSICLRLCPVRPSPRRKSCPTSKGSTSKPRTATAYCYRSNSRKSNRKASEGQNPRRLFLRKNIQKIQNILKKCIDKLCHMWYNIYTERRKKESKKKRKEETMKKAQYIIKELTKLMAQLDKLLIKIISAVGWVLILIEVLD